MMFWNGKQILLHRFIIFALSHNCQVPYPVGMFIILTTIQLITHTCSRGAEASDKQFFSDEIKYL
jgi:hypothetical protein